MTDQFQQFIIARALENLLLSDDPNALSKLNNPNAKVSLLGMTWTNEEAKEALGRISDTIKEAMDQQVDMIQAEFHSALNGLGDVSHNMHDIMPHHGTPLPMQSLHFDTSQN